MQTIEELYDNYNYFFNYLKKYSNLENNIIEDIISESIVLYCEKYFITWNKESSDLKTYFINFCKLKILEYVKTKKEFVEFTDIEIEDEKETGFNIRTINFIINNLDDEKKSWYKLLLDSSDGIKIKDISIKWNINENTVKTRIKNIRQIIIEEYSRLEGIRMIPFEKKKSKIKAKRYYNRKKAK